MESEEFCPHLLQNNRSYFDQIQMSWEDDRGRLLRENARSNEKNRHLNSRNHKLTKRLQIEKYTRKCLENEVQSLRALVVSKVKQNSKVLTDHTKVTGPKSVNGVDDDMFSSISFTANNENMTHTKRKISETEVLIPKSDTSLLYISGMPSKQKGLDIEGRAVFQSHHSSAVPKPPRQKGLHVEKGAGVQICQSRDDALAQTSKLHRTLSKLQDPVKDIPKVVKCIEVVRNKRAREDLPGHECEQCSKYYSALQQQGIVTDESKSDMLKVCSRHKGRWTPPSTPDGFWDIGVDTPESWK